MKTFFSYIVPRIQRFSQNLDDVTILTNQHWVAINGIENSKIVYIFRPNNELLISQNGKVEKAKWEYLGNNSLLIDIKDASYLFKNGFIDDTILALKIDSKNEYAFFINDSKYDKELNSINSILELLSKRYANQYERKFKGINRLEIENSQIKPPKYAMTFLGKEWSLVGGMQKKYRIEFSNGKISALFIHEKSDKYRIICHNTNVYYSSKLSAIEAIYFFILTGKISENNRIYI